MGSFSCVVLLLIGVINFLAATEGSEQKGSADGYMQIHPRVIGGTEVWDTCRPPYNYMAALQIDTPEGPLTFCSAVIINETILMTTSFCATQVVASTLLVSAVLGERDLFMKDKDEQRIAIESVKIHPGYSLASSDNNIALLRLATPGIFSSCVKPAAKMEPDPAACSDMDRSCLIVGWGPYLENTNPTNSRLPRYASVILFGDLVTRLWSTFAKVQLPLGCLYAEAVNPNIKACLYDWGGIVSCQRNGNYVLRGLVSNHNCLTDTPVPIHVTDVPMYDDWQNACLRNWERC